MFWKCLIGFHLKYMFCCLKKLRFYKKRYSPRFDISFVADKFRSKLNYRNFPVFNICSKAAPMYDIFVLKLNTIIAFE